MNRKRRSMDENNILCGHGDRKMNPSHWVTAELPEDWILDAEHSSEVSHEVEDMVADHFRIQDFFSYTSFLRNKIKICLRNWKSKLHKYTHTHIYRHTHSQNSYKV